MKYQEPKYVVVKWPLNPTYKEDKFYYVCQFIQDKSGTTIVKCGHCKRGTIYLKHDGLEGNIFCKVCDAMVVRVDYEYLNKSIPQEPLSNGGMGMTNCGFCDGTGKIVDKLMIKKEKCPKCDGFGYILIPRII